MGQVAIAIGHGGRLTVQTNADQWPTRDQTSEEPFGEGADRGNGAPGAGSEEQRYGADARRRDGGELQADCMFKFCAKYCGNAMLCSIGGRKVNPTVSRVRP